MTNEHSDALSDAFPFVALKGITRPNERGLRIQKIRTIALHEAPVLGGNLVDAVDFLGNGMYLLEAFMTAHLPATGE